MAAAGIQPAPLQSRHSVGSFIMKDDEKNLKSSVRVLPLDASNVFHLLAFLWYTRVWAWHFTPDAAMLPGARGFGWFFKYLTFYSYTLQLLQLGLCCMIFVFKDQKIRRRLQEWADDISCAIFGLAGAVTIMYHVLEVTTKGMDEEMHIPRPPWLGVAVHVLNFVVACVDFLLAHPRSFSQRAEIISVGLSLLYVQWILLCSYFNKSFPYPFLNNLPWPQGFMGIAIISAVVFMLLFRLGRCLSGPVNRLKTRLLPHYILV